MRLNTDINMMCLHKSFKHNHRSEDFNNPVSFCQNVAVKIFINSNNC